MRSKEVSHDMFYTFCVQMFLLHMIVKFLRSGTKSFYYIHMRKRINCNKFFYCLKFLNTLKYSYLQYSLHNFHRFLPYKMPMYDSVRLTYVITTSTSSIKQLFVNWGSATHTICTSLILFREVCSFTMDDAPKLVDTHDQPVQIDEAILDGRE